MCFCCVTAGLEFRSFSNFNDDRPAILRRGLQPRSRYLNRLCQAPEPHSRAADNEKVASAAQNVRRDVSYSGYAGGPPFRSRGIEVRSFHWV